MAEGLGADQMTLPGLEPGSAVTRTFDCLNCGGVFWAKAERAACPDCGEPLRLRGAGDRPPEYWLTWGCDCDQICEGCRAGRADALSGLAALRGEAG